MNEEFRYQALKASAGTGKTFNLSARYIALLLMGAKPSQIIAITFTNKSANEMKKRITWLFDELGSEKTKAELEKIAQITGFEKDEILAKRDELKEEFMRSNLKISTFDAFFGTILRAFALNAGLNANYQINENADFEEAVQRKFIKQISQNKDILDYVASFLYQSDHSKKDLFDMLNSEYFDKISPSSQNYPYNEENQAKNDAKILCDELIKTKASSSAIKIFAEYGSLQNLLGKGVFAKDDLSEHAWFKNPCAKNPQISANFDKLKTSLAEYFRALELYELDKISQIAKYYKQTRNELNKSLNALTFGDVTKYTSEILGDKNFRDLLYFRLDGKINHLLIDEFQDTSATQYAVLSPIIDEIVSGLGVDLGSFFYVGDTKQSIYKFRGGIKELFDKVHSDYGHINVENLDKNYRSSKNIVDFVNDTFIPKYGDELPRQSANSDNPGYVKVRICDEVVGKASVQSHDLEREAICKAVVEEVKNLIKNGVKATDIVVLCWKNSDIDLIKSALKNLQIEASGEGKTKLYQTPLVRAIIEFIKYAITGESIYKENTKALLGRKNLPKFSLNFTKTPQESVKYVAEILGISLGEENITKLCEIAESYDNIIDLAFADDKTSSNTNDQNAVTLMTAHKSKGLEFHSVIVCDKMGGSQGDKDKFIIEYDTQKGKYEIKLKQSNREFVDEEYKKIKEIKAKRTDEDNMNKLYVACTRAKNNLVIVRLADEYVNQKNEKKAESSYFNASGILSLKQLEIGEISKSKSEEIITPKPNKKIEILKVGRQEVENNEPQINQNSVNFGSAMHYVLEMMNKFDEKSLQIALIKAKNKFQKMLTDNDFSEIEARLQNLIKDEKFIALTNGARLHFEQSFKISGEIKRLDLLAIKGDKMTIIDYKSGLGFGEQNIEQVKFYKQALAKFNPNFDINAVIIYILSDKISFVEV